jgi:hypothetical protein
VNWQSIAGVSDLLAPNTGSAQITDPNALSLGRAFYHVVLRPKLTVSVQGNVGGTVTSDIGGINCGAICSAIYSLNDVVTLTGKPDANYAVQGWSACAGNGTCAVTMDASKSVTATFIPLHHNCLGPACGALGQPYTDFTPVGTYNVSLATAAANAWSVAAISTGTATCTGGGNNMVYIKQTTTSCAAWNYSGSNVGHVNYNGANNTCFCPISFDPNWN